MAVYDWIGAMHLTRWFTLYVDNKDEYIPPNLSVAVLESQLVHMTECSQAVALSDDPEVTFRGFDVASQVTKKMEQALPSYPVTLFEVDNKPPANFMALTSR